MEPSKPDRQKVWDQDHRDPSLKGFLNWIPQPKRQWHKERLDSSSVRKTGQKLPPVCDFQRCRTIIFPIATSIIFLPPTTG